MPLDYELSDYPQDGPLMPATYAEALNVGAHGVSVARETIDGCVVIYAIGHEPTWLRAVQMARDEDGNTHDAIYVTSDQGHTITIEFRQGTAITGTLE